MEEIPHTYPIKAYHENLEFRICEKTAYIQGSLHKFYNRYVLNQKENPELYPYLEDNNYNDFYYLQIIHTLETYKELFDGLDLDTATISELEFGFNITTQKPPKKYIEQNFLLYQYKAPVSNYAEKGKFYKRFEHNKFAFKIYSKKDQKHLDTNILRIEIVIKSTHLKLLNITRFSNLFKEESIDNLYKLFCENFEYFLLVDNRFARTDIQYNTINSLGNYLEPTYWIHLKGTSNINRKKQKLQELLKNNNLLNTRIGIIELLIRKYEQLRYGIVDDS
ncbi:MAG: hypothetical protein Q4A00_06580 [Flavobacteriaceae bacterium]|nr:hypothetical protein [Flavobacteriaceae bacterium]